MRESGDFVKIDWLLSQPFKVMSGVKPPRSSGADGREEKQSQRVDDMVVHQIGMRRDEREFKHREIIQKHQSRSQEGGEADENSQNQGNPEKRQAPLVD